MITNRKWTIWFLALACAWTLAGWLIVPAVIRSAFGDGVFGVLSGLMPGRAEHTVDVYLAPWTDLAAMALLGLVAVWFVGLVVMQPITWRLTRTAYLRIPTFGGRFHQRSVALFLALVSITVIVQADQFPDRWSTAPGWEYESVATSLVDGHGFSFPPGSRWLVLDDERGADQHGVTAWKEPVYPHLLAASFSLFGPHYGRLAVVLCQMGFLLGTSFLIYRLGTHLFGVGVGVSAALATVLLLDLQHLVTVSLQIPAISSLLFIAGLLLIFRYGDHPSLRRAIKLGVYLGLAALTHAVLIVLVPIAALFMVLHGPKRPWFGAVKPALLMGLVAAMTISPWTIRNYAQFGHLIPVQTGFGTFANASNTFVAETYMPGIDACGDGSPPIFEAEGPLDAILALRKNQNGYWYRTHQRSVACVAAVHAEEYFTLNEHERDGLHKQQLVGFAAAHPLEFLELTAAKTVLFVFDVPINGRGATLLAALGILGMLLTARKPRMWVFPIAILAYTAPYALTAPLYFRYQAPMEPMYSLFAVVAVVTVFRGPIGRLKQIWGPWSKRYGASGDTP